MERTGELPTPAAEHPSLREFLTETLSEAERQRVLLITFNQWDFATSALADIGLTLHGMGTQPQFAFWSQRTPLRDVGWNTSHLAARLTVSPARDTQIQRALMRMGVPKSAFVRPPVRHWSPIAGLPHFSMMNRTQIRTLHYRNSPMGRGILQVHPDRQTPITDEHQWPEKWLNAAARSYAYVFDQTTALIEQKQISAIVVYNGRFLHDSAAASAAEQVGLPILSYDMGGSLTDFDLTRAATHDWSDVQDRMKHLYFMMNRDQAYAIGSQWFEQRRAHLDPRNQAYVESQERGTINQALPPGRIVTYFSSSGDEIVELDLDWQEYFGDQAQALSALAKACRTQTDTALVVRSHPHKRRKPTRDVQDWFAAVEGAAADLHLDPHSPVDSYALIDRSDVVVTYGSTTGVEAAYAGKSVIVMGPSAYDELGCAVRVRSQFELEQALATVTSNKEMALPYGLFMMLRGFRFTNMVVCGPSTYMLGDSCIREPRQITMQISDILKRHQYRALGAKI